MRGNSSASEGSPGPQVQRTCKTFFLALPLAFCLSRVAIKTCFQHRDFEAGYDQLEVSIVMTTVFPITLKAHFSLSFVNNNSKTS